MKKYLILFILISLVISLPVFASDVSSAEYISIVHITNNSTSAITNGIAVFSLSTLDMITGKMINATANDAAMLTGTGGTDITFMPGWSTNPWCTWVSSIGAKSNSFEYLYSKGAAGGKIAYFPGSTGMAVTDNAILEPAANFTIGLTDTFIDTGVADKLAFKNEAISLFSNGTGNITGALLGGIDAGSTVSDRASACPASQTWLTLNNPVNANGVITKVSVWSTSATSIVVGTFYGSGVSWTCRDYETITVTAGSAQTKDVSLNAQTGDILGMFATSNHIDLDTSGGAGMLQYGGAGHTGGAKTYTLNAGYIASIYATGYSISVTSAVAAGEHDVTLAANSTNLTLTVDGSIVANSALGGASVPDNANNWQIGSSATIYITAANITVGGALKGSWAWMYGATFTDLSGNGRTATPTFRTTSSDANMTASIDSQESTYEGTSPSSSTAGGWTMITTTPGTPERLFTEGGYGFPLGPQIKTTAESMGQNVETWLFAFAFAIAMLGALLVYIPTHNLRIGQKGSLLLSCLVAEGILVYFYTLETVPGWALIPVGLIGLLLLIWRKSYSPLD